MRSPTAEHMLQGSPGYVAKSAGIDWTSRTPVDNELIAWADLIFVMESMHRLFLEEEFPEEIKSKQIHCLNIPDEYQYMDPGLVQSLRRALARYIELPGPD